MHISLASHVVAFFVTFGQYLESDYIRGYLCIMMWMLPGTLYMMYIHHTLHDVHASYSRYVQESK